MQYFSLTARYGDKRERCCAMLTSPSIEEAADQAHRLLDSGHLSYVEPGARYAVRPSSRRETCLLQKFFASCNMSESRPYHRSDFDSLLHRRSSLLMSFFAGLYLAPETLREKLQGADTPPPSPPAATTSPGGGVSLDGPEAAAETGATPAKAEAQGEAESRVAERPVAENPVDNSSQDAALVAILGSPEASDGGAARDAEIDLGDDLF